MCPNITWIESKLIIHNRHQINTCDLINYVIVYGHWVCSRQHLSRHGGFSKRFSGKPLHFLDVKMLMVWKKQHKADIKFLGKFVHFLLKLLVLIFSFRGKKWKGGLIIAESLSSELCDLPLHICKDVDKGNAAQKIKAAFGLLIFSHYDVLKYFPRSIFSSSLHSCTISSTWLQNGRGHILFFFFLKILCYCAAFFCYFALTRPLKALSHIFIFSEAMLHTQHRGAALYSHSAAAQTLNCSTGKGPG